MHQLIVIVFVNACTMNATGAAEIRHVLVNIGEQATDEEVSCILMLLKADPY